MFVALKFVSSPIFPEECAPTGLKNLRIIPFFSLAQSKIIDSINDLDFE